MIASALRSSAAGGIFLLVPLVVLQLFVQQVSLNSSAPIGQDGHDLVSLLGDNEDPKYLECKGQLDADASALECSKIATLKYPSADDLNRCHKAFYYSTCTFQIACSICTADSVWAWTQVVQGQLEGSVSTGKCRPWASECPHLSNCPTKPTTSTTPTTAMLTTTVEPTTAAPFPIWIIILASVVTLFIVVILLALVLYFVWKPEEPQVSKRHGHKLGSASPRVSTGKRLRTSPGRAKNSVVGTKVKVVKNQVSAEAVKNTDGAKTKTSQTNNASQTKNISGIKNSSAAKYQSRGLPNRTSTVSASKIRSTTVPLLKCNLKHKDPVMDSQLVIEGSMPVSPRISRYSPTFRQIREKIALEKIQGTYRP